MECIVEGILMSRKDNDMEEMTLGKIKLEIEHILQEIEDGVQSIRGQNITDGYLLVASLTEKIEKVIDYIPSINKILTKTLEVNWINSILGEIIEGIQNEDTVLVGDLLEYELKEKIEEWLVIIEKYVKED